MHFTGRFARAIIRDTFTFNRTATEIGSMLRCTAGVVAALWLGHLTGRTQAAPLMAIGAFICGFISLEGVYRSRVRFILATACGIAAASYVGELTLGSLPVLMLLAAVVGYLNGVFAQLSRPAGAIALYISVTFIVFSHQPLTQAASIEQSILLLAGAGIQIALLIACYPFSRFTLERRALAAAFDELGDYADTTTGDYLKAPPARRLIIANQVIADPQPFARVRDVARFKRLLRDLHVLRMRFAGLHALHDSVSPERAAAQRALLHACTRQLHVIARFILARSNQSEAPKSDSELRQALDQFEVAYAKDPVALSIADGTILQLRDALQGAAIIATGKFSRFLFVASPRPSQYIETRVDWRSREALRLAVALFVAMLLGHTLFVADRGYWIALTVVLVLKPDMRSTFVRGISRIGGTIAGALLAMQLLLLPLSQAWLELGLVVFGAICYATFFANYGLFTVSVTAYVVFFLTLIGFPAHASIDARVLDTLIGGGLALCGYVVLPTFAHKQTREAFADLLQTQAQFADAVLAAYTEPQTVRHEQLERLRIRAWKLRMLAESLADRARSEPARPQGLDAAGALDLLAATQSLALVNLAMESGLETVGPSTNDAIYVGFRAALAAELQELVAAVRFGRPQPSDTGFQTAAADLEQLHDKGDAARRFLRIHCSGYVQSAATIRSLCEG